MGASVLCHTWWSLVWSRSGCNAIKKCYCGNAQYDFCDEMDHVCFKVIMEHYIPCLILRL